MNVAIGAVAAQFLFWEYLFQIFGIGSMQCILLSLAHRSTLFKRIFRLISCRKKNIGEEHKSIFLGADLEDGGGLRPDQHGGGARLAQLTLKTG